VHYPNRDQELEKATTARLCGCALGDKYNFTDSAPNRGAGEAARPEPKVAATVTLIRSLWGIRGKMNAIPG
jgi:hypothetical protein